MGRYYYHINEVKEAAAKRGSHFFDKGTMRFFNSRALSRVYGGRYFITSERYSSETPRTYSIREIDEEGRIETVGTFGIWRTKYYAEREIFKKLEHEGREVV